MNHGYNPLNGNPAVEPANHEPARALRSSIYDSVKNNLDISTNALCRSIQDWSVEESAGIDRCIDALESATDDLERVGAQIQGTEAATELALQHLSQAIAENPSAELLSAQDALLRNKRQNTRTYDFLRRVKYRAFLAVEHEVRLLHAKADAKRVEFRSHLDAINDITEVMSGNLLAKTLWETAVSRHIAALRAALMRSTNLFVAGLRRCANFFVGGITTFVIAFSLFAYFRIVPRFVVFSFARFVVKLVDANV